jgi:hypothetical protein
MQPCSKARGACARFEPSVEITAGAGEYRIVLAPEDPLTRVDDAGHIGTSNILMGGMFEGRDEFDHQPVAGGGTNVQMAAEFGGRVAPVS